MNELKDLLSIHYNIQCVKISRLEGYANANYKVESDHGEKFVLKAHHMEKGLEDLFEAEGKLLAKLAGRFPGKFQEPIVTKNGQYLLKEINTENTHYRLLRWIDGDFYYDVKHTPVLFSAFGKLLAEMDQCLMEEYFPAIQARKIDWDLQDLLSLYDRISLVEDLSVRKKVHYFMMQFRENVAAQVHSLRKSIIHNDANDWNLLVKNQEVGGIIDFGDMVVAPLIQELAVHLTYALFEKEDPLKWVGYVLKSYHAIIPLRPLELDLLYYFIAGRLCMSLVNAAFSKSKNPDNTYLSVSEKQAIRLLDHWFEINPDKASEAFRLACGLEVKCDEPMEEGLERRFRHISKAQSVSYHKPIKMKRAAFQFMYDGYGNTFLDAYNNIPHVGHSHPRVVEAGQKQMAKLNTNTRYLYDELAAYSEKLIAKFPDPLNKVFFVNSGSAASDLAIRMAQTHTGKRNVMVMEHGYHGHTRLGIDISHYKFGRKGGRGKADYIIKTAIPDTYRGEFTNNDGAAGKAYAAKAMQQLEKTGGAIAAFIAEPVVGCAGQVPLAKDYLKHVYPAIRKQGGICISDEVQTGFGRMGSTFWGFELQGVVPDIVVLGKPMGNGHPMAAVVTTDNIANSFDNGMEFFSSFGGNPVSCAIGKAVLEVIEEEELQVNAYNTGSYFLQLLNELKNEFECIGDVRGHGLFLGVEMVKDKLNKEHHTKLANQIKNHMRDQCILVSTDGPFDNILKMKPPLCFDRKNADRVYEEFYNFLKIN